jgi:drug/metabolite transporter (DMT)-like permease
MLRQSGDAVILGVLLLKEPFRWRMAVAGGIVLAGVAWGAGRLVR